MSEPRPFTGNPLPITTIVNGRRWNLYDVQFTSVDGTFTFGIYALSDEHASYLIEEIKKTATLNGQILGRYSA